MTARWVAATATSIVFRGTAATTDREKGHGRTPRLGDETPRAAAPRNRAVWTPEVMRRAGRLTASAVITCRIVAATTRALCPISGRQTTEYVVRRHGRCGTGWSVGKTALWRTDSIRKRRRGELYLKTGNADELQCSWLSALPWGPADRFGPFAWAVYPSLAESRFASSRSHVQMAVGLSLRSPSLVLGPYLALLRVLFHSVRWLLWLFCPCVRSVCTPCMGGPAGDGPVTVASADGGR